MEHKITIGLGQGVVTAKINVGPIYSNSDEEQENEPQIKEKKTVKKKTVTNEG